MKYLIKAALIDMDGVITKTVEQHSRAWKKAFDITNSERKERGEKSFSAFSIEEDYSRIINGIPRYDAVQRFLHSRKIELPYGSPDEEGGTETVCGIGNLKNGIYQELLIQEGVEIFEKNVSRLREWKEQGIKLAVISSSKSCKKIMEVTGLEDLFDVRLDGIISAERKIPGKPAPDIFLEGAAKLGVDPKEALVVEDAILGVEAGKKGGFKLVIGIKNAGGEDELLESGADVVVKDLQELEITFKKERTPAELPSGMEHFGEISQSFENKPPLLFLDFDGTLAPIVEHHDDAAISDEMRNLVKALAEKYPVAVVSGRGREDVKKRVGLHHLFYAGSHGFEISGPKGFFRDHDEAVKVLPVFEDLEPRIRKRLQAIQGVDFERKKFTLAVHYRQVKEEQQAIVHEEVSRLLKDYPELIKAEGKKVIEIRPAIDWHKGKAVEFLKSELSSEKDPLSLYVGDDVTDEDAFEYVSNGLGILVGEHGHNTFADYRLQDIDEVKHFFRKLLNFKGLWTEKTGK